VAVLDWTIGGHEPGSLVEASGSREWVNVVELQSFS